MTSSGSPCVFSAHSSSVPPPHLILLDLDSWRPALPRASSRLWPASPPTHEVGLSGVWLGSPQGMVDSRLLQKSGSHQSPKWGCVANQEATPWSVSCESWTVMPHLGVRQVPGW